MDCHHVVFRKKTCCNWECMYMYISLMWHFFFTCKLIVCVQLKRHSMEYIPKSATVMSCNYYSACAYMPTWYSSYAYLIYLHVVRTDRETAEMIKAFVTSSFDRDRGVFSSSLVIYPSNDSVVQEGGCSSARIRPDLHVEVNFVISVHVYSRNTGTELVCIFLR